MHKRLDRNADKFELYLARNIFKVPSSAAAATAEVRVARWVCVCFYVYRRAGACKPPPSPSHPSNPTPPLLKSPRRNPNPTHTQDAMDVDKTGSAAEDGEEEEGGSIPLPASASEVPPPQDEEAVDNLLTEARVRIRTVRPGLLGLLVVLVRLTD